MIREYEPNEYYVRITEVFKRADGTNSWYSMLSGDGSIEFRLSFWEDGEKLAKTKENVKKIVNKELKQYVGSLDTYKVIENDYGWVYERFVKVKETTTGEYDADVIKIVGEGEHTDRELFEVEVFYIREEVDAYSKLQEGK